MSTADDRPVPDMIRNLLNEADRAKEFRGTYRFFKSGGVPNTPCSVLDALEISDAILSPVAREALEALEACPGDQASQWLELKWKLTAFLYVQDIFDTPLFEGGDGRSLFHQYYFYHESHHILAESVLCGLNGFDTAATALLRLFLEFTVLQNYYYRLINKSRSYVALEEYFRTGTHHSWHTLLKKCLPKDDLSNTVVFASNPISPVCLNLRYILIILITHPFDTRVKRTPIHLKVCISGIPLRPLSKPHSWLTM